MPRLIRPDEKRRPSPPGVAPQFEGRYEGVCMAEPMLWNTLSEAADWLNEETGEKWNPKRIMSFVIDHYYDPTLERKKEISPLTRKSRVVRTETSLHPKKELEITCHFFSRTHLSVMLPSNMKVGMYRYIKHLMSFHSDYKTVAGRLVCTNKVAIRTAPLYVRNLLNIFMYGEDKINFPSDNFNEHKENCFVVGWEFALFEPLNGLTPKKIRDLEDFTYARDGDLLLNELAEIGGLYPITVDMVGIDKESLQRLLGDYQKTEEFENQSDSTTPAQLTAHQSSVASENISQQHSETSNAANENEFTENECSLFSPLQKRQIEKLFSFIDVDQWRKYFDKAARNGLSAARSGMIGKANMYNPASVANWLVQNGHCSPEHAARTLANNLPQRSKDKREDLLNYRGQHNFIE